MDPATIRLECLKLAAALGKTAAEVVEIAEKLFDFATHDSKAAKQP